MRDPLGGINSLWPLFGIANQIAGGHRAVPGDDDHFENAVESRVQSRKVQGPKVGRPAFALVTLVPLMWLLAVTMTAGWQKIFHNETRPDFPHFGFLQIARDLDAKLPGLEQATVTAKASQ